MSYILLRREELLRNSLQVKRNKRDLEKRRMQTICDVWVWWSEKEQVWKEKRRRKRILYPSTKKKKKKNLKKERKKLWQGEEKSNKELLGEEASVKERVGGREEHWEKRGKGGWWQKSEGESIQKWRRSFRKDKEVAKEKKKKRRKIQAKTMILCKSKKQK